KRSGAWKLRIAMPVPIPAQRQTAKICALSHVQQCSRVPTLNRAMAEHRGFPRENRSMISSHLLVQGSGGEVHDNGILNRHVAHCAHQHAFDPVIRERERTTLI